MGYLPSSPKGCSQSQFVISSLNGLLLWTYKSNRGLPPLSPLGFLYSFWWGQFYTTYSVGKVSAKSIATQSLQLVGHLSGRMCVSCSLVFTVYCVAPLFFHIFHLRLIPCFSMLLRGITCQLYDCKYACAGHKWAHHLRVILFLIHHMNQLAHSSRAICCACSVTSGFLKPRKSP